MIICRAEWGAFILYTFKASHVPAQTTFRSKKTRLAPATAKMEGWGVLGGGRAVQSEAAIQSHMPPNPAAAAAAALFAEGGHFASILKWIHFVSIKEYYLLCRKKGIPSTKRVSLEKQRNKQPCYALFSCVYKITIKLHLEGTLISRQTISQPACLPACLKVVNKY